MEVQTVSSNSLHGNPLLVSPTSALTIGNDNNTNRQSMASTSSVTVAAMQEQQQKQKKKRNHNKHHQNSFSISPASSSSEIDRELDDLILNGSINSGSISLGNDLNSFKSNGSLSGVSSGSVSGFHIIVRNSSKESVDDSISKRITKQNGNSDTSIHSVTPATSNELSITPNTSNSIPSMNTSTSSKKRMTFSSSSRTPTKKARRIKFYRNGDRFYPGLTIPVSNERYRSFDSLFEDLTRLLEENVKIPGAVRTIYTMCGKKIGSLDDLEDGQSYICSCNNESFKKIEYNTTSQPLSALVFATKTTNRLIKTNNRPSSPLKNGGTTTTSIVGTNGSPVIVQSNIVFPRIVTLIRSGTKPRKIMRLLLNKRNSPTFDHVLTAITQVVRLDTYVRKVFTLSGSPVLQLADFFGSEDVFFAYGAERVNNPEDFKLEVEEQKAIQAIRKTLRTDGTACKGPKPKMPIKSKNIKSRVNIVSPDIESAGNADPSISSLTIEEVATTAINDSGIVTDDLPSPIRERYVLGEIIGDGNFAIVLKMRETQTGLPYALKIIDKSKCRGKEHYIDAEVRVMKKLSHPHIISLIMDVDRQENMFLVLEYVSGGDLFDAITRVTRFSEDQSRVMIRHLASAMAYLHSMSIVHRDIKPENLLVELDDKGNVIELKLADFGLACEVTEPLFAVCGTPTYVAPEILMETGYDLKIDVWAAGIILYILLCGFPPFVSPDNEQEPLFDAIIKGVYEFPDPYWSDIGEGVRDLINNMLQSDPEVRFTSEDILDHYWTMGGATESYIEENYSS